LSVYVKKKLVSSQVDKLLIKGDEPLCNIVDRLSMPDVLHDYLRVSIDGVVIPKENWQNTIATTRHIVFIAVVPQGGGGDSGKNPLASIAMIALSVFSMGVVAPWAAIVTDSLIVGYGAAAGVMFVGMLAINALFPPPSISTPNTKEDSTGFFGMDGFRNRARPHDAVRNIFGTYKVAPDLAVEAYAVTSGNLQTLYGIYDFGYGEVDLTDIKIGNTAIASYGGYYAIHKNYTDGALSYYKNDNVSEAYSTEIRDIYIARVAPSDNSNEIVVDITFPMGLAKLPKDGGIKSDTVPFVIYIKNVATGLSYGIYDQTSFKTSHAITKYSQSSFGLTRTTSKSFVFSFTVELLSQGEWEVSIKRTATKKKGYVTYYDNCAGCSNHWLDKTVLTTIRSVTRTQPLEFKVPHTILELKIVATDKLSGMVDTLTAVCERILPYYSSSVLAGTKATSNPAWIALNILMGDENPDPIPASRIDFSTFELWATFCGDVGDDTDDYHCDCNWDANSTVFERLISVMVAGRATIATRENKYSVIYEQFPTVPSQLLTTKNSWGFKGTKIFTKQPHALNVSFIDPDSEWQQVDRIVYADGYTESNSTYFENITLPLCTSSDRAWKAGRYYLAQGQLRPESFIISTDVENLLAERGDLIELQYDAARMGGIATRITAITGAVITLREPVSWAASPDYYLRIRTDDGQQEEIQVISQTDSYTITFKQTLTQLL